ncbi:OmpA family protein [Croceicoccus sp. BE223]|uniref:OmpA family protein n=1 Tax=Croceicoccus sp. BE223 TaxID=2817716 RepID=UPI0028589482|nr:OmpA family protein [Croceicoccus sp. BE223]MDR7101761.1 outer membrane protein OmpA-like peptidoglycan-associated protein [Croceicoccus sp. BE223]
MNFLKTTTPILLAATMLAVPAVHAQNAEDGTLTTVYGEYAPDPSQMTEGPDVDGVIVARMGDKMKVRTETGDRIIAINDATEIKAKGGFLGLNSKTQLASSLFNGLPIEVKTKQAGNYLLATSIKMKSDDLKTASMIFNGTDQRFTSNEAATEALKGRMGDIDQYNIKGTTNVNFDTGKANLTDDAKQALCSAASQAEAMDNALLLVVGYTDSRGSEEYNQMLSEKRASSVVNYLQQACGWKPYRMLTPTGMSESDPAAPNDSDEGMAQNRRVAVNILVSKAVDGL